MLSNRSNKTILLRSMSCARGCYPESISWLSTFFAQNTSVGDKALQVMALPAMHYFFLYLLHFQNCNRKHTYVTYLEQQVTKLCYSLHLLPETYKTLHFNFLQVSRLQVIWILALIPLTFKILPLFSSSKHSHFRRTRLPSPFVPVLKALSPSVSGNAKVMCYFLLVIGNTFFLDITYKSVTCFFYWQVTSSIFRCFFSVIPTTLQYANQSQ